MQVADGKGGVPIAAQNPGLARRQGRPREVWMDVVIVIPARLDSARVRCVAAGAVAAIPRGRDILAAGIRSARADKVSDGKLLILDPPPPPFLSRKLKNAVNADPGNAGFPVSQPALLGGDETAENAALSEIDGIIPFIAVFAGRPGFRLAESVGLVDAAVEGFAPIFGQGLEDGGRAVVMGKGLPVGAVPGDGPGLGRWIPPPPAKNAIRKAKVTIALRRDTAISSRLRLGTLIANQYKPGCGVCQPVFGAILINMDIQD